MPIPYLNSASTSSIPSSSLVSSNPTSTPPTKHRRKRTLSFSSPLNSKGSPKSQSSDNPLPNLPNEHSYTPPKPTYQSPKLRSITTNSSFKNHSPIRNFGQNDVAPSTFQLESDEFSEEPQEILYYPNQINPSSNFNVDPDSKFLNSPDTFSKPLPLPSSSSSDPTLTSTSSPSTPNQPTSRFSWDSPSQVDPTEDWLARVKSLDEFFGGSPSSGSGSSGGKLQTPPSQKKGSAVNTPESRLHLDSLEEVMKKVKTPEWKGWNFDKGSSCNLKQAGTIGER